MGLDVYRITLELTYETETATTPDKWDWKTLLDLGPDEGVILLDTLLVDENIAEKPDATTNK